MSFNVNVGGTWQALKTIGVNVNGSWQSIKSVWVNVNGTWRQVFNSLLTATASPTVVSGRKISNTATLVVSSATTVTAAGGSPGYTYAWAFVSGDPMTVNNPSGATTSFQANMSGDSTLSSVYRCTVHDASGQTATADVSVTLNHGTTN